MELTSSLPEQPKETVRQKFFRLYQKKPGDISIPSANGFIENRQVKYAVISENPNPDWKTILVREKFKIRVLKADATNEEIQEVVSWLNEHNQVNKPRLNREGHWHRARLCTRLLKRGEFKRAFQRKIVELHGRRMSSEKIARWLNENGYAGSKPFTARRVRGIIQRIKDEFREIEKSAS